MDLPAKWRRGPRPDPSVIELLDQLSEAARKGHIRACAIVTVNPLLEVEGKHAGDMDNVKRHLLIAGLASAEYKLKSLQDK